MIRPFTKNLALSSPLFRAVRWAALILLVTAPLATRAADSQEGYAYVLHNAMPSPDALSDDPSSLRSSKQYVSQGPRYTLIWHSQDEQPVEHASFARGERRFGLFVPYWDPARSASEEDGWSSYGRPVTYQSFAFEVQRGDRDRRIADHDASHYVVEAQFTNKTGTDPAHEHTVVTSDLWVLEDKPFSFAPFSTAGIYADPRLQVALAERLADLGMVVRVETRYSRQPREEDGSPLRDPREAAHLAWVTDLKSAEVADVEIPVASEETVAELRKALREDPDATCATVMNGDTPEFVQRLLNTEQQRGFMGYLETSCQRRMQQ